MENQNNSGQLFDTNYRKNNRTFKIFTHSLLFLLQSIVFTMPNTIYFEIFTNLGILKLDEKEKTAGLVSHVAGAFFIGKLISDPLWGMIRDRIGDKKSITIISISLFVSLVMFGLSKSLFKLCLSIAASGLASGIFVSGAAFVNWIEPESRDYLSMWIFIFSAGGALVGPFVGSFLMHYMPYPKILFTWGSVGVLMLVSLVMFMFAFRDFDDSVLIAESHYSKLEDINNDGEQDLDMSQSPVELQKLKKSASFMKESVHLNLDAIKKDETHNSHYHKSAPRPKVRFEVQRTPEEMELELRMKEIEQEQLKLLRSRKKVSKMSMWELLVKNPARRNLLVLMAVSYTSKVTDWIVFPIWAELEVNKGGLGFSSLEAGAVTLLSFPMVSFLLVTCFDVTKKGSQSYWLMYTNLAVLGTMVFLPIVSLFNFEHETLLFISIVVISIKEGSYLVFQTTWNQLMTKIFPSMMLGRAFSMSYFFGHVLLLVYSQIFPRLLTFVMVDDKVYSVFGVFRFFFYFGVLGLNMAIAAFMSFTMKIYLKRADGIDI